MQLGYLGQHFEENPIRGLISLEYKHIHHTFAD